MFQLKKRDFIENGPKTTKMENPPKNILCTGPRNENLKVWSEKSCVHSFCTQKQQCTFEFHIWWCLNFWNLRSVVRKHSQKWPKWPKMTQNEKKSTFLTKTPFLTRIWHQTQISPQIWFLSPLAWVMACFWFTQQCKTQDNSDFAPFPRGLITYLVM